MSDPQAVVVAALYRFTPFPDFADFRDPLLQRMADLQVRGTLLLAPEGINGTIAGSRAGIDGVLSFLRQDPRFSALCAKESLADRNPFYRAKVKLKQEIVTLGVPDIDPLHSVGTYVRPEDWNALISDPDVVLIDTRNDYEHRIGTFRGAVNPGTDSFRQFPDFVKRELDPQRHRKVAMFCTGGIRCEKSTAYLKQQGFEAVYHLQGGILNYLEHVAPEQSLWEGECFVFDQRVTVDHQLRPGSYDQCHACRMPISAADKASPHYLEGVRCPHCHDRHEGDRERRFAERERQKVLSRSRGESHIGRPMAPVQAQRRQEKLGFKDAQRRSQRD